MLHGMLHHIDEEFLLFPFRILLICHSFYNFPLNWQVSLRSALFQPLVLKLYSNETRSLVKETFPQFFLYRSNLLRMVIGTQLLGVIQLVLVRRGLQIDQHIPRGK